MSQPQPPPSQAQPTAYHPTRRFNAVQVHCFEDAPSAEEARARVAALIRAVNEYESAGTEIVVGIAAPWLRGLIDAVDARNVVPFAPGRMRPTAGDVLVQITADTETGRLYGQRLVAAFLERACLETELQGSTRLGAREAFGYHDGDYGHGHHVVPRPSPGSVTSSDYPLSFALYQRWVQDVDHFFQLHPHHQDRVIGKDRDGQDVVAPQSHVAVSRAQGAGSMSPLLRRNVRYRVNGEEGMAFVAMASSPRKIRTALDNMLGSTPVGPDAVLEHAESIEGGIYAIVQDLGWLLQGPVPAPAPLPPAVADLRVQHPYFLYELTEASFTYMQTLRFGMLEQLPNGDLQLTPDMQKLMAALHHKLAGGEVDCTLFGSPDPARLAQLDDELKQSFLDSNAVNGEYRYYVTVNA